MAVSKRKASGRKPHSQQPRRSDRASRPTRRVQEAIPSPEASPSPSPPPNQRRSTVLVPDSQPSSQATLLGNRTPFIDNSAPGSQNSFSAASFPSSQPTSEAQAFLNRERALARPPTGAEAETAIWEEANRLQNARLLAEAQVAQPRVSFTHILGTNPPPFSPNLLKYFPAINRKYFTEIFRGVFNVENLHKLANDFSARTSLGENEGVSEPKGLSHLLRCFEAYCQIVLEFSSDQAYRPLQFAMSQYRIHLHLLLAQHTFESVAAFHRTFVYARICEGQDNPQGWVTIDPIIEQNHLVRKGAENSKPKAKDSSGWITVPTGYCRKFNLSLPCPGCAYKHTCFHCQSPDHAGKACPTSSTNRTPISNPRRS